MTKHLSSYCKLWETSASRLMEDAASDMHTKLRELPESQYTLISDLSPEDADVALKAFAELAYNQRGLPEDMGGAGRMGANKGLDNATGIYTALTEHIGDLTHRMSQRHCENINFGYELVLPKVEKGLRYLTNPYGFDREVMGNIRSNLEYRIEMKKLPATVTFEDCVRQWKVATHRYAEAHAELVVYNDAQWKARQAAIELGNRNWEKAIAALTTLKEHLASPEQWNDYAGVVMMSQGRPLPV